MSTIKQVDPKILVKLAKCEVAQAAGYNSWKEATKSSMEDYKEMSEKLAHKLANYALNGV